MSASHDPQHRKASSSAQSLTVDSYKQEIELAQSRFSQFIMVSAKDISSGACDIGKTVDRAIQRYRERSLLANYSIASTVHLTVILAPSPVDGSSQDQKPACGIYFNLHSSNPTQKSAKRLVSLNTSSKDSLRKCEKEVDVKDLRVVNFADALGRASKRYAKHVVSLALVPEDFTGDCSIILESAISEYKALKSQQIFVLTVARNIGITVMMVRVPGRVEPSCSVLFNLNSPHSVSPL